MYISRKLALPFAIMGSSWAILITLFLFYSLPTKAVVSSTTRSFENGRWTEPVVTVNSPIFKTDNLPVLGYGTLAGVIGLVELISVYKLRNKPRISSKVTRICTIGMILLAIALLGFGYLLIPSILCLAIAGVGMGKAKPEPEDIPGAASQNAR